MCFGANRALPLRTNCPTRQESDPGKRRGLTTTNVRGTAVSIQSTGVDMFFFARQGR
jgi:hypothetical protein